MRALLTWVLLLLAMTAMSAIAVVDIYTFEAPQLRERYQRLSSELRCPKCQNQSLADSDSMVAQDLRRELHRLLSEGKSDVQIKQFMVARYGEFVLYKPRMGAATWWLWLLPMILLLIAGFVLWRIVSNSRLCESERLSPAQQVQLAKVLMDKDSKSEES